MEVVHSVNGVPIRLPEERWRHITSNKPYMEGLYREMLDSVEKPAFILRGYAGSLVAVVSLGKNRFLHTVYKELGRNDGFIITAFVSRKFNRGLVLWPKKR